MLLLGGEPLLRRVAMLLAGLADDVIIVTSRESQYRPLVADLPARFAMDVIPGRGPLGGIYTALLASRWERCIVTACDLPLLNSALLAWMVEQADSADAVVPRIAGKLEPLHAVYRRSCIPAIQRRIDSDPQASASSWLADVRTRYVGEAEIERFDPGCYSLWNVNTPEDFAAAEKRLAKAAE